MYEASGGGASGEGAAWRRICQRELGGPGAQHHGYDRIRAIHFCGPPASHHVGPLPSAAYDKTRGRESAGTHPNVKQL